MFKIDVASAVAAMPAPAAAGTPGFFTDGNPVTGVPATIVPADFLNLLMMEVVNVIAGANLAPSKTDNTQLLQAIQYYAARGAGASGNFAPIGHLSIPVGSATFTLNWGYGVHTDNSGAQPVVFDRAYDGACLCALAVNGSTSPPAAFHSTGSLSKSGMTVYSSSSSQGAAASGTAFRWIALGA